ncbi:hypothetical protein [Endozoicomonas sp. ONNA2]|uniref:hypothetical protein n=1 Tax=Endozoicomonas sp. ONNA2 TaxID=2828741 RepID=UPI002147B67B|nr:hypothetical protein [Endozoicomonas sp. ONNA2]
MNNQITFTSGNPYLSSIEMNIDPVPGDDLGKEKQDLVVQIYTDVLHLRSVEISDLNHSNQLFSCAKNMKNFGAGEPLDDSISESLGVV